MPMKTGDVGIWWDAIAGLVGWLFSMWITYRSFFHRGCMWRIVQVACVLMVIVAWGVFMILALQYRTVDI